MNQRSMRPSGSPTFLGERRWLFFLLSLALFVAFLLAAKALMMPSTVKTVLRADLISLDKSAETTDNLITPVSLDAGTLRETIFADSDLGSPPTAESGPFDNVSRLIVERGDQKDVFVIELTGWQVRERVGELNALVTGFVEDLNQDRIEQRSEAERWAEDLGEVWQAKIDEAKAAIVQNPFNPDVSFTRDPLKSEKLLRMMIDATAEAQMALQYAGGDEETEREPTDLSPDLSRLTIAMARLEAGKKAQLEHGTALKEAELGLADHRAQTASLFAQNGDLSNPAAEVLSPAAMESQTWRQQIAGVGWPRLLLILAILSGLLGLLVTYIVGWLFTMPSKAPMNDVLNDPNWPLPSGARRDLSD